MFINKLIIVSFNVYKLGGALTSRLHGHAQHGDPSIRNIVQRIMDLVCSPIYSILTRWILHGDLYDPYDEFFIGTRSNVI
jgi:gamma-tubulin complex component 3